MRILEGQPKQVKWLLIAGGAILLIIIAIYFATKKKTQNTASDPTSQAGQLPSVLVLPQPYVVNQPAPTQLPINPASNPPVAPGQTGPTGILGGPILIPPSGLPAPTSGYPSPIYPGGRTGPTGIVTYPAA